MKKANIDYFPAKLAKEPRFCNRIAERAALKRNIELIRHTVLISPRRYGKSSLVHQVISELHMPCAYVDLFLAHNDQAILKRLSNGIGSVISELLPTSRKTLKALQTLFERFRVHLTVNGFTIQTAQSATSIDSTDFILELLHALDCLAEQNKQNILIFIDEFQDITVSENAKSIQGAIRHIAQDTSHLIFIFSGSNRQLLQELFDDSTKPLYMLCDKMRLDRMSFNDYRPYIQEAALKRWGQKVDDSVVQAMLALTELHPFYVNLLGNELCKSDQLPNGRTCVLEAWQRCYDAEERRFIAELEKLTTNQQRVIKALVSNPTTEPTSHQFVKQVGLSASSTRAAIDALLAKDMVRHVKHADPLLTDIKKDQYRVLDPLLAYALAQYT